MRLGLLERHIATAVVQATAMALLVLVILLIFFGLIEELEDVGRRDYALGDAFLVAVLSAPRYMFEAFPVAALLGSLIGLGAMGAHGELVAMRSVGFSLRQIVGAVLKTGLAMSLVVFAFGELVAPPSEQWAGQLRTEKLEGKVTLKSRYGFWARDGRAFINIRTILPGGRLEDIYIYEFDEDRALKLATHAARAEHRGDHWVMFGIRQSSIAEEAVGDRQLDQARWDSLLDPGLLNAILIQPVMLPITELYRYIQVMKSNEQAAIDYEVAFWVKLATPLATLVMLFIAVPFVLGSQRFVGMGQRVFFGAVLGMAFYTLSRGMSYASVVYGISPLLSALIPAAAFLGLGIYLMRRAR